MSEYQIFGQRCDIVEGVVKMGDRTVVIGKIDRGNKTLETTTIDVPDEYGDKLASAVDGPVGGTDVYTITPEADE